MSAPEELILGLNQGCPLLRDFSFPLSLNTSDHDLHGDFFVPALENARFYDRGVGYFSSGWLSLAAQGMGAFATNGGRARWVTSPILSASDWKAMALGVSAQSDPVQKQALQEKFLASVLERDIAALGAALQNDVRSALSWMIADDILSFKLALPVGELDRGDFHDKFGIFRDECGDAVAFNGSYNDSVQGTRNYESLKVFCSWHPAFEPLVREDAERFEHLWNNCDPNVRVFDLPDAAREGLLRLREAHRPYRAPQIVNPVAFVPTPSETLPVEGNTNLWSHQREAIAAWEGGGRRGMLAMATGAGKTRTALEASARCPSLQLLLIAVPRKNLVEQWAREVAAYTDFPSPILVYDDAANWQERLFRLLRIAGQPTAAPNESKPVVAIGTFSSLVGERFASVVRDAGWKHGTQSLLLVDEAHGAGAPTFRRVLDARFGWRLGLSATPVRHFDDIGSAVLDSYFGGTVYSYDLAQALADGHLTPYVYEVEGAHLTLDEYENYRELTRRVCQLRGWSGEERAYRSNVSLDGDRAQVEQLLFRRARILKQCAAKMESLERLLHAHPPRRALIYCADGEQLGEVCALLEQRNITHATYTKDTSNERRAAILDALDAGHLSVIVAIDCLDEGVDVPNVDMALILASSTNKRQFIQRRGRILRRAPNKARATLLDVVALPPLEAGTEGKKMLRGELARAREMAQLALNREAALLGVKRLAEPFGVLLSELLSDEAETA